MEEEFYGVELYSPGMLLIRSVARGCILTRERKWKRSLSSAAKLWVKSQKYVTFPLVCPRLEAKFVRKSPISRSMRRRQKREISCLWRHSLSESTNWTLTMSKSLNGHELHRPPHIPGWFDLVELQTRVCSSPDQTTMRPLVVGNTMLPPISTTPVAEIMRTDHETQRSEHCVRVYAHSTCRPGHRPEHTPCHTREAFRSGEAFRGKE